MINIHELRKNNYELYKKLLCGNMLVLYQKYGDRLSIEELQEIKKKYISRKYYQSIVNQNKKLKEKNRKLEEEDIKMRAKYLLKLDNYVSKDKIREKIKELEQFQEQHKEGTWGDIPIEDYDFDKINLLKELLGE